jgi:hypothetical protein
LEVGAARRSVLQPIHDDADEGNGAVSQREHRDGTVIRDELSSNRGKNVKRINWCLMLLCLAATAALGATGTGDRPDGRDVYSRIPDGKGVYADGSGGDTQ